MFMIKYKYKPENFTVHISFIYIKYCSVLSHRIKGLTDLVWFDPFLRSNKRAQTIPASCSLSQPIVSGSALRPDLIGCDAPLPCGCWRWSSCHPVSRRGRWLHGAAAGWSSAPLRYWCSDCPPEYRRAPAKQRPRQLTSPVRRIAEAELLRRWQGVPGE